MIWQWEASRFIELQMIPSSVFVGDKNHGNSCLLKNTRNIVSPDITTNSIQFSPPVGIDFISH
jgi:hypothetical protein